MRDPAAVEDLEERPEAAAPLAQQVGRRHARALEAQLAGRRRVETQLVLQPPDAEPGRVGRDDEGRDLGVAAVRGAGPGGDDVRAGLAGIGDEALGAIDHPRSTVGAVLEAGGRAGATGIGAGAGLGQAVRAEDPALRHRDEEPLLLLRGAGQVERPAAEATCGRPR